MTAGRMCRAQGGFFFDFLLPRLRPRNLFLSNDADHNDVDDDQRGSIR